MRRPGNAAGVSALVLALFALYALYAAIFILHTSFLVEGRRFFCLFDDAMVSMRYAKNLAQGHGLVWNPGAERVEGYTNPLWVLYMAAWHLLPIAARAISLPIQVTGAVCVAGAAWCAGRIADRLAAGRRAAGPIAVALTAFYLPLNNWSLQGMEVGLLAWLVTAAVWSLVRAEEDAAFPRRGYVLLAAGVLVRLDMAVPLAVWTIALALIDRPRRTRHLVAGFGTLVGLIAALTLIRVAYYGETLPNTYYLKMTGYPVALRISRGALVALAMIWRMNAVVFAAAAAAPLVRRDTPVRVLAALVGGQFAYSIYVGGDAWEWWGGANRYICIAMPLFFAAFAIAVDALCGAAERAGTREASTRWVAVVFAFVALLNVNILKGPLSLVEWAELQPPMLVEGNREMVSLAIALKETTREDATVAVTWAGSLPYFADRRAIDLLGKNDRRIAREPMRVRGGRLSRLYAFLPGHLKWNYAYSLGELQPDIVAQLWEDPECAMPFLRGYEPRTIAGQPVFVRTADLLRRTGQVDAR